MGWLWSSSPEPTSIPSSKSPQPSSQSPQTSAEQTIPTTSQPLQPSQTSDEAEFHAAFPHLAPSQPTTPSTTSSPPSNSSQPPQPPQEFSPDPNLPTTMSCRQAMDSAFYCRSIGGRFNDIYRYGQLRDCSEHWSDFWFCMGLKTRGESQRVRSIQEHFRKKEERLKAGRHSEEVWRVRGPGEKVEAPFGKSVEF